MALPWLQDVFHKEPLDTLSPELSNIGDDDLSGLFDHVDVEANINADDFLSSLPDDLDLPMLGDQVLGDELWQDGSDSSDSGVDTLSVKHEPLSPASSQNSDFSNESSLNASDQLNLMDYTNQFDDGELMNYDTVDFNIDTIDNTYNTVKYENQDNSFMIKTECPDTPPLTPQYTVAPQQSLLKNNNLNHTSNTARAITFNNSGNKMTINTTKQVGMNGAIKVVLPSNGTKVAHVIQAKSNTLQPKPHPVTTVQPSATKSLNPLPQGKPIVLTQAEFAKLTSQGVLKIQSSASSSNKPTALSLTKSNSTQGLSSVTPVLKTVSGRSVTKTHSVPSMACGPLTDMDLKSWKRQQRMIKNRESACLSRKRKKEYLNTIESRLEACTHQNERLKHENNHLRKKVDHLLRENELLKSQGSGVSTVKKVGTSLLLICVLLSLNLSPLTSIFTSGGSQLEGRFKVPSGAVHHGRKLMALDDSPHNVFQGFNNVMNFNMNDIADTMNSLRKSMESSQRGEQISSRDLMFLKGIEGLNESLSTMCPLYYNKTDSQRLVKEITGWFMGQKQELKRKQEKEAHIERKRKNRLLKKLHSAQNLHVSGRPSIDIQAPVDPKKQYQLQVFKGQDKSYEQFLHAIHYKNDTFYIVSFRRDQLFVPATVNRTIGRPKMSLLMPGFDMNDTMPHSQGEIPMMQIDCEITATHLLHIHKSDIPASVVDNGTFFMTPPPSQPKHKKQN